MSTESNGNQGTKISKIRSSSLKWHRINSTLHLRSSSSKWFFTVSTLEKSSRLNAELELFLDAMNSPMKSLICRFRIILCFSRKIKTGLTCIASSGCYNRMAPFTDTRLHFSGTARGGCASKSFKSDSTSHTKQYRRQHHYTVVDSFRRPPGFIGVRILVNCP